MLNFSVVLVSVSGEHEKKNSETEKTKKKRVSTFIIYGPSEMENAEFCFCFHLPVDIPNSWAHFAIEPT